MDKEWLFGKTLSELTEIVTALGMPRFTATQIVTWLYKKNVTEIDQMTNLSVGISQCVGSTAEGGKASALVVKSASAIKTTSTRFTLHPPLQGFRNQILLNKILFMTVILWEIRA